MRTSSTTTSYENTGKGTEFTNSFISSSNHAITKPVTFITKPAEQLTSIKENKWNFTTTYVSGNETSTSTMEKTQSEKRGMNLRVRYD